MCFKARVYKWISVLLAGVLLLPACTMPIQGAETKESKVVRVGYMLYDGYQNGAEGEVKSGSVYEYYQKIKSYTGWEYEYVYGSIRETFERLENGEIDIMAIVTKTPEREQKFLFSDESHGMESYYLYTHVDNNEITPANLETLDGKTIGVTLNTYQDDYIRRWCRENNIECTIQTYEYNTQLREALNDREIDAMIDIRILGERTEETPWKSIYRFASDNLYFAVNKDRTDLLEELNDAQAYIVSANEFYAYEILQKYHDGVNYYNTYLTTAQKLYLESVGTLRVGYLEGMNPLSFTGKSGKMEGLCAEYLEAITQAYGIQFEQQVYRDENRLIQDLQSGKLDIILPIGMGYWAAEQAKISLSTSMYSLPMTVIYNNTNGGGEFEKIAVIRNSPTQEGYIHQYYPNAEMVYVSNTKEALNAIKEGRADCYFIRSSSLDYLNTLYPLHDDYRTMSVQNNMEVFMATRIGDATLSIILDKGISLLTDAERDSAKLRHEYEGGKISLWEAIKDNAEISIVLILLVISVCASLIIWSRLHANQKYMKSLEAARDKAQKAEAAKTEFLSQMSHDIRTPMNAIIGFTNFIKEEDNLEIIKEDYIPKIEVASNHLIMLINDVLEMSRIETGKLAFNRSINNIAEIIDSIATVMRMQAAEKNIELVTEVHATDKIVNCDQHQISRVLLNLLSNALKFTPEGGRISVLVNQKPNAPEGFVNYEIKVIDTGIGMKPEFLEHIFEPFERERTSTDSGMQGTGLGMSIVKYIVDSAGDHISVDSVLGQGTTITLNTKLIKVEAGEFADVVKKDMLKKHYSLEELREYFKGRRVLLVEDNEFNRMIAYTILENAGFLVETAENGQQAVQAVINAPVAEYYDCILMDVQMPVMNGYEATKSIRALEDDRARVKIIAVTANAFETDREAAQAAGMNGHIAKPLDVDVLYQTLLEITEG